MRRILVLTDLDGSLLDTTTYSYEPAREALALLEQLGAALILVSSKTRSEMEPLRRRLHNSSPFIVENGGALFIPRGIFPFPLEQASIRDGYEVVELGTAYTGLRAALNRIRQELGGRLRGFGDLSIQEVAQLTGLSADEARLATQREYDEPFVVEGDGISWDQLEAAVERQGLRCTRGGRFYHVMGANDKGLASTRLISWYRRAAEQKGEEVVTIGLGDSLNDRPMLAVADYPILIQKPDGSYDPEVQLPHLIRADGVGPVGWNRSLSALLYRLSDST
ncbi:MAG: HAD-IIB family hydrolase [Nitrospira sp.]|nr:HAD-IIB family hydrolase [Nitrospira sp.]